MHSLLSSGTQECTSELNPYISLCLESQQELCAEPSAPLTPHWGPLPNPQERLNPFQEPTSSTTENVPAVPMLQTEAVPKQLLPASQFSSPLVT